MKLPGLSQVETDTIIPANTILLGYVGSMSHGTYVTNDDPDSIDDKDIQGICIGDRDKYFGLGNFEQKDIQYKEWDSVVYEIRKFFRLLLKGNPNVLSLLWLREEDYIIRTDYGRWIIENRNLFASRQVYDSYVGYANGQLKRMTHAACKGYMGAKRKALVERFGYDTKNAAHLIRILRMGIEFLLDGELRVFRHDREMLKEIKRGNWTLDQVKVEAGRLFRLADEAFIKSTLPNKPDYKKAEELLINILESHFGRDCFYE